MNSINKELRTAIEKAESIIIFSHVNPDGDTLGSNLSLSEVLEQNFNKKVDSVYIGKLPSVYTYLPKYDRLKSVEDIDKKKIYDVAIAVDVASKDRLISGVEIYDSAKLKVNIDHHKTNIGYGDININEPYSACVGMVLYKIFKDWGIEINCDIAKYLYTSLMTDTGNFRYENTTPEVFKMASELVEKGVSPCEEYRLCYESKPQNMLEFQLHILNNARFYNDGKIAVTKILREDMKKYNASEDFSEGIVEVLRTSKDVEVAAILKENNEGNTKVSLRSKNIDITPIVKIFNGGGHTFAAGCTINKPINIAYDKLLECIQSEIK